MWQSKELNLKICDMQMHFGHLSDNTETKLIQSAPTMRVYFYENKSHAYVRMFWTQSNIQSMDI